MRLGRGLRGGGHNGNFFIDFFHVSEHVDHFKAIKVFSLRIKREKFGVLPNRGGGYPPT